MSLILRSAKLDPLTHDELDNNFEFLDDKIGDIDTLLTDYVEVPSGVSVGDTIYWDGTEWAVTSTLNADTVTNGVYTTGDQTIGGVKTFTSTISGSIDGTAPKLQTPRNINGTPFDGSGNIETGYWGPSRHLTISGTTKVVDGKNNVSWTRNEINANEALSADVAKRTEYPLVIDGVPWDGSSSMNIQSGGDDPDAVKLTGNQQIFGLKQFEDQTAFSSIVSIGSIVASQFVVSGGQPNQILLANGGFLDANTIGGSSYDGSDAVKLSGDQTISGVKSFTDTIACRNVAIRGVSAAQVGFDTGSRIIFNSTGTYTYGGSSGNFSVTNSGGALTGPLTVTGNITAYYSDVRLKEKTGDITDALESVAKIDTFLYKNNDLAKEFGYTTDEIQVGVSAQSVEAVLPQVVSLAPFDRDEDGTSKSGEEYKTVDYARLSVLLIQALKEAKERIEILESKVD